MDCKQYDEQLLKLQKNEEEISFFQELLSGDIWQDFEARKELMDYVIDFCEENGLDEALAWMCYNLGFHYYEFANYKKAIELHKVSRDIFMNSGNKNGLAHAYNGLLTIYCQNGQHELANQIAISAIDIARELGDRVTIVKLLLNASINYIMAGSNMEAKAVLDYILKEYGLDILNENGKIVFNKTLADVEINLGNFDAAYTVLMDAIELNKRMKSTLLASEMSKLLAMYYGKTGNINGAEIEFDHSFQIASDHKHLFEECETLIEWAKFRFTYKLDNEAIEPLKKALDKAKKNNFVRLIKDSSMLLYSYYNKNKRFEEALSNLELYLKANREIQDLNNTSYIGRLYTKNTNREINLYKILHDKTETLFSIGQKILSTFDVKEMIDRVFTDISKIIETDSFAITVYNQEKDEMLVTRVEFGNKIEVLEPIKVATSSTFSSYCIKNKKAIIINDVVAEYGKYVKKIIMEDRGVREPISMIFLPIMFRDEILGVVTVQSLKANMYDEDDIKRLRIISNYIAISLKNATKYQKMEEAAVYDSLTGFLTKRELIKLGTLQIEKFKKLSTPFCILMIDIDDFKNVNDTYGHLIGDRVLKALGTRVPKLIRSTDFIGRYGGDEFVLVCPDTKIEIADKIASRICEAIGSTDFIFDDNIVVPISLSIGVHEFNSENSSFLSGVDAADSQMYLCKNTKIM